MNRYITESIELLRKMIAVPSESFHEDAVADLVEQTFKAWGMAPRRLGNNVFALKKGFDKNLPTLVLDAHLDTVPAASGYTRDPFNPGTETDMVFGLGANDDGGSAVSMTAAFRCLAEREMGINLILCLDCEEEKSGPGGARMLYGPEGPEELRNASWIIFGEPTGMRAATSERGLLVLDGTAVGVSGHAARHEGVNALYIAMDDISALRNHEFTRVSESMGKVGLNVTQINAGTAHNVIPDKCSFVVDIRPTEKYSCEEILEELQSICKSTLVARNLTNRSSATRAESPLLRTAASLGIETFSSPTTSNWMRWHGDGIKMGPGDSARSHHADEFIMVSEIEEAVRIYIDFIETLNGNTLE